MFQQNMKNICKILKVNLLKFCQIEDLLKVKITIFINMTNSVKIVIESDLISYLKTKYDVEKTFSQEKFGDTKRLIRRR